MRKHEIYTEYFDAFEYYGKAEVVRIRRRYSGKTVRRDWLVFETPDKALRFFKTRCGEYIGYYH